MTNACCDVHGHARHVLTPEFHLARMKTGAEIQAEPLTVSVMARAHSMALAGPSNVARVPSPVRLYQATSEPLELALNHVVVAVERLRLVVADFAT